MAAAAIHLPPSGLWKFPSDQSDAPEGERGWSQACPPGQLLIAKTDGMEHAWPLGRGHEMRRGPLSGLCGAAQRVIPIPRLAGGITDWPTTAGKPSFPTSPGSALAAHRSGAQSKERPWRQPTFPFWGCRSFPLIGPTHPKGSGVGAGPICRAGSWSRRWTGWEVTHSATRWKPREKERTPERAMRGHVAGQPTDSPPSRWGHGPANDGRESVIAAPGVVCHRPVGSHSGDHCGSPTPPHKAG